jgi:competence protein ComEC
MPARRLCRGTPVIDRIDTWRKGGHAVWLGADGIRIETVRDWQGARPWTPVPVSARERAGGGGGGPAPPDDPAP